MKIIVVVACAVLVLVGISFPGIFADNVPSWVKNTAGWWAMDAISEKEFVNAIEFLVKENIIQINEVQTSETSQSVPSWVKNTAGWWAMDAISEKEFVNAIAYLIKVGIISIESTKSPELIAEMWINGRINDDEFLANVEHLIEIGSIPIPANSITNMPDPPDWLVNNAGWWAARIFTNSDFDFDPGYVKERIYTSFPGCMGGQPVHIDGERVGYVVSCPEVMYNSYGLRGDEFEKEKQNNTYRIFAVGGSSTFGRGVDNSQTWPAYLQQLLNEKITDPEFYGSVAQIEVINAGFPQAASNAEYGLIKNKLSSFDPDLIIMYDGWNDGIQLDAEETIQNWERVCKLGKDEGFDTIIIVQPLPITGLRVLTEQETEYSTHAWFYSHKFQQYVDGLKELESCSKTIDFRGIFDYIQAPVFYDSGHTLDFGNKIIAKKIFSVIYPTYFGKTHSVIYNNLNSGNNELGTHVVYAVGSDLSNRNFDNLNLQNAVFDKADLSNTSFKNTNIDGARFVYANLNNSNLLDQTDLSNINLAGVDLSNTNLKGKNLSGAILTGTNLTNAILTDADLTDAVLYYATLTDANLENTILTNAILNCIGHPICVG